MQDKDKGELRRHEYILILVYMKYFVFIGYVLGIFSFRLSYLASK